MIFCIHYAFIMFGYCSCGLLLGRYMLLYANATELDLGFVFMIHPLAMFARPIICARADRFQSHKKSLFTSVLVNSLAYTPFIAIPYIRQCPYLDQYFTPRVYFWILLVSHAIGSIAFCGVRSLGDALAVNYAKKVGSSFGDYRKYGALGYGVAGFLLGTINQNWYLPDYVPAVVTNVVSLFINSLIIYNASDDYFRMVSMEPCLDFDTHLDHSEGRMRAAAIEQNKSSPNISRKKNQQTDDPYDSELSADGNIDCLPQDSQFSKSVSGYMFTTNELYRPIECSITKTEKLGRGRFGLNDQAVMPSNRCKRITVKQQIQIFFVLIEYDIRIPLFFLFLFVGGLLGYAPPNYVFTYMDKVCSERQKCDSAFLSGLTMLTYCCVETLCYIGIRKFLNNMGHSTRLKITLVSLAFHFFFYAFALRHLSPYFFLIEVLHGLEYSISLTSSVELGYKFANEVGLLIPELLRRGIITAQDDQEKVRLSLAATMNSCFTLIYEGAGTMAGVLIYGFILDLYSFETVWFVIGVGSVSCFLIVSIVTMIGRCWKIEPKIKRLLAISNGSAIILS